MNSSSVAVGVSFALFLVWMYNQGRIALFAGAVGGDYLIKGTSRA